MKWALLLVLSVLLVSAVTFEVMGWILLLFVR